MTTNIALINKSAPVVPSREPPPLLSRGAAVVPSREPPLLSRGAAVVPSREPPPPLLSRGGAVVPSREPPPLLLSRGGAVVTVRSEPPLDPPRDAAAVVRAIRVTFFYKFFVTTKIALINKSAPTCHMSKATIPNGTGNLPVVVADRSEPLDPPRAVRAIRVTFFFKSS